MHGLSISTDTNSLQHPEAMRLYRIHGTQQWRLLVDALAEMGHESLTETEAFLLEEKKNIYITGFGAWKAKPTNPWISYKSQSTASCFTTIHGPYRRSAGVACLSLPREASCGNVKPCTCKDQHVKAHHRPQVFHWSNLLLTVGLAFDAIGRWCYQHWHLWTAAAKLQGCSSIV